MSQIFVANPTLQNRQLQYRINAVQTRVVEIRAGGQERLPDDLEGAALGNVVSQLERAGAVPENDPKAIRNRFSLLYKVADTPKPITTNRIDAAGEQDLAVRQELSAEQLEKAAASAFNESAKVGGREVSLELTQVTDHEVVKGGVDTEITVSAKRGVSARSTAKKK